VKEPRAPRFFDISPLVSERIGVWPGDRAYRRQINLAIASGSNIDLSEVQTTLHVGAHVDAPSHFAARGAGVADLDLEPYFGRCELVDVPVGRGQRVRRSSLPAAWAPRASRVLFRTGTFPDPEHWNLDFASLSGDLLDWLGDFGVRLVGIDTPSVDLFDDKVLEAHQVLARRGIRNIEGLVLRDLEPGLYTLAAFPLRLEGADASPVRAVLMRGA
jgi:arylformamidase